LLVLLPCWPALVSSAGGQGRVFAEDSRREATPVRSISLNLPVSVQSAGCFTLAALEELKQPDRTPPPK
jgi:hypothetical protein